MSKYIVEITETLVYKIEVEADSEQEAEDMAYASQEFSENSFQDNDSKVTNVKKID